MVMMDAGSPIRMTIIGRSDELTTIGACVQAASTGRPCVVWVGGEAGSGKSVLVGAAIGALPPDFQVVHAHADELAIDVPFEVAAQLGQVTASRPFAAGLELLDSWSRLQDRGPVAIVVEDLHWADQESRQALLTAAKRLDRDRLVMIITSRPDSDDGWQHVRLDEQRCRTVVVGAFDVDEVSALAASLGYGLTHREAERLHAHTRGHPLYVRTLLGELTMAQLQEPDGKLPAPRSLASTIVARLSDLSSEARGLAASMAVVNQRCPMQLVGRVAGIVQPTEAFEELLTTGFVAWEPDQPDAPVEFAHPLYRLAVYEDLSPSRRRDLHRAAATALPTIPALAHRVAAADGADDGLADELEAAARAEIETGALELGSRHFLWASSLSGQSERAERRLAEAAWALLGRGQVRRAVDLRAPVEACRDSALRSLVLGMMDWEQGEGAKAERWLLHATTVAHDTGDETLVARAWAELGAIYATEGRAEEAVAAAEASLRIDPSGSSERLAWTGLAMGEGMLRGARSGLDRLRQRLPETAEHVPGTDADLLVSRGTLSFYAGRTISAVLDMRAVLRLARQGTVAVQIARSHLQLSSLLVNTGEWDEAFVHARLGADLVADDRLVWMESQSHAVMATILGSRGDQEAAETHAAQAIEKAHRHDTFGAIITSQAAVAAIARARHQPERVVEALAQLPSLVPMFGALFWWPTLITGLIDTGQIDRANASLADLTVAADARGLDFRARLAWLRARSSGAQGRPDRAVADFEDALRLFGPDDPFLDRALVHFDYGRLLQAKGDRREAVAQLRIAHQLLSDARAAPYVERVDADLAASGIRSETSSTRSVLDLTGREQDVAHLVARGLSNPEVAAELYISRKAVEYHLGHIYGKLGIKSRRELRTVPI